MVDGERITANEFIKQQRESIKNHVPVEEMDYKQKLAYYLTLYGISVAQDFIEGKIVLERPAKASAEVEQIIYNKAIKDIIKKLLHSNGTASSNQ